MSLKIRAILVVVVGVVLGFSLSFSGQLLGGAAPDKDAQALEQARLLAEVLDLVKQDYVESVDDAVLLDSAIRGMVSDLDPHSQYLDAAEYRDIRASTTGTYTGIGIEVDDVDGTVTVVAPIAGSPAARAGIRRGDEVVAVNGTEIEAGNLRQTIGQLRGRAGSHVTLTVQRDDEGAVDYEMRRQRIQVASVHKELLGPALGYVRVSQFTENTSTELGRAVDELQHQSDGMLDGLVLDLRNNPGGVLDAAVEVSDLFLDSGLIVAADGRTEDARFTRSAHQGDVLDGANLVVLVNSGSASASEIVAGALQDHDRALVLGTATFGKGLVQTVMPLSRGRAIKLTTSRYYTPSGDSIHDVGIAPDVFVEDTAGFPDASLAGITNAVADAQLAEALEHLQAVPVMHSKAQ